MGRTLHFTIAKDDCRTFTEAEYDRIMLTSIKYNSGQFKDVWTCENFWADPLDCVPNRAKGHTHDTLERRQKQLAAEGLSPFRIAKTMVKEGIAQHYEPDRVEKGIARGFVKVQGNEMNALLVLTALAEISTLVPSTTITLTDEGRFLLCDIYLKKGKVRPDMVSLRQEINRFLGWIAYGDGETRKKLVVDGIDEWLLHDMLPIAYKDADGLKHVNEKLTDLAAVSKVLMAEVKAGRFDGQMNLWNLEDYWLADPFAFSRTVDVEKYREYQCSAATLMDGFEGEGFGLTDEDPEEKSYRSIAQIMKLFGGLGVEVLGAAGKK